MPPVRARQEVIDDCELVGDRIPDVLLAGRHRRFLEPGELEVATETLECLLAGQHGEPYAGNSSPGSIRQSRFASVWSPRPSAAIAFFERSSASANRDLIALLASFVR